MAVNTIGKHSPINPTLKWLWDMLGFFSQEEIKIAPDFHGQVADIKSVMQSDTSGIVSSILDFAIKAACVDFTIETDKVEFKDLIQRWFELLNRDLNGRVPGTIKGLAKEYYRELWKNSSLIVLRTKWAKVNVDGTILDLPVRMWLVDGSNIEITDNSDTRIIGEEKYYLKINDKDTKQLPASEDELIFIQKPFNSWSCLYPTPFIIQRGLYKNLMLYNMLNRKTERVIGKALEYLFIIKKGTENLALKGSSDFIYSQEDLTKVKQDLSKTVTDSKNLPGIPTHATNFDTEFEHLIPDFKRILDRELYAPIEKRLLAGLGMVEVVDSTAYSRRESVLNPKPFVGIVEQGITDFISLISDVLYVIKQRNIKAHPKYFGNETQLHYAPIKEFIDENIRNHLRSMYDRGIISKRTYAEVVGNVDSDVEAMRRNNEIDNDWDEVFAPPKINNKENNSTPSYNDTRQSADLPREKKETALEEAKIEKQKDGWHVLSEKTGKNLGGPYKTKKEAITRLKQVEYWKTQSEGEEINE